MHRKIGVSTLLLLSCVPALASQLGQPLDCSDWVFLELGLSCGATAPSPCPAGDTWCTPALTKAAADNQGRFLRLVDVELPASCPAWPWPMYRHELRAFDGTSETVLAYIEERCGSHADLIRWLPASYPPTGVFFFPTTGRLLLPSMSSGGCISNGTCPLYDHPWTPYVSGFASLFEIVQTYTPTADAIQFRVPVMPEGLQAADYFDTYWGHVQDLPDFTQAQPMHCHYPQTPPAVGDYLTVADMSPTPVAGAANYTVTAVTRGTQRRYGRKRIGSTTNGRDPALLPACP